MKKRAGFTLVEIMIVVAIIGLLAAIAIPSFVKARQTSQENACINNLRQVDAAKEQAALTEGWTTGMSLTTTNETTIESYIKNGEPDCPAGGVYVYNNIGSDPTCNVADHDLPN